MLLWLCCDLYCHLKIRCSQVGLIRLHVLSLGYVLWSVRSFKFHVAIVHLVILLPGGGGGGGGGSGGAGAGAGGGGTGGGSGGGKGEEVSAFTVVSSRLV